jgi:hypothetical protein
MTSLEKRLAALETATGTRGPAIVVSLLCGSCGESKLVGDNTACGHHAQIPTGGIQIRLRFVAAPTRQGEANA